MGGDLLRERLVLRIRSVTRLKVIPMFSLTLPRPRRCDIGEEVVDGPATGDVASYELTAGFSSMAMLIIPTLLLGLVLIWGGGGGGGGGPARCWSSTFMDGFGDAGSNRRRADTFVVD